MPLSGPVGTPLLGGVAIVSRIFLYQPRGKPISMDKPQKTKEFKESGPVHPHAFSGTPPFVPVPKSSRSPVPRKPLKLARQTGSENRVARYVE